ncbi:unnamed protein product [Dibothriocephalus latus]|uniref:E3 ubiquitin-protein ligase ARIH1-like UBA-like domain-containing protein n=1 Tax=Dibothriocephalus latus TaxID=60516 RepID=A0A3P7LP96_DIBLA|nr:unnamed protein product [Dibothriocephalus latus]
MDIDELMNEVDSLSGSDASTDVDNDILPGVQEELERQEQEASEYEALNTEDLIRHMSELIEDVSQVINLHKTLIRLLLERHRWDKNALIESYFEEGEPRLFAKARIDPALAGSSDSSPSPLKPTSLEQYCKGM